MKCPADGQEMTLTAMAGIDNSYRCGGCGGCWTEGWVINKIAEGGELKIEDRKSKTEGGKKGELHCPEDGKTLGLGSGGGEMPEGVEVYKCEKCRKWWLPGNTIFDLAKAFAIKKDYLRAWKRKSDLSVYTLPVVLTAVLVLGMGMILRQVQLRQMMLTQAAVVKNTTVRYLGNGKAEIKLLVSGDLGVVEYRPEGEAGWRQAAAVSQGEWQVAVIDNVRPGQKFLLRWNRGIVQMTVGQSQ